MTPARSVAVAGAVVLTVAALWFAVSGRSHGPGRDAARPPATDGAPPSTVLLTTTASTVPAPTGVPAADTPAFRAAAASLWAGVVSGTGGPASAAFFPESAYLRLKSLGNPASDYENRLLALYDLDIAAAHSLLGPNPGSAALVRVDVPLQYAHWIPPGVCDNRLGYYEVPNSRVVYRQAGAVRSFGIASMISWEGDWYVVHLGAVVRSRAAGTVDAPASGPGVAQASSTC